MPSTSMKVLLVTQYFWPEDFRVNDLATALSDRGHDVEVLTGMPNYPSGRLFPGYGVVSPSREHLHGVSVLRVPLLPRGGAGALRLALNYLSFALAASLLAPFRCRGDRAVTLVFAPSPITACLPALVLRALRGTPVALWVQDLWPESVTAAGGLRWAPALGAVRALSRFIYRRCALVLVQSRAFRAPIEALGTHPDRIHYYPNWAEPFYGPAGAAAGPAPGEVPDGFVVLFAGNLGAAQSLETLVEAAEHLRAVADLRWVVVGDGRRREWLTDEVRRRGLAGTVTLLERRPPERMPELIARADVLLVTLRADPLFALTIPSKVQTYLASGKPIAGALDGEGARVIEESGAGRVAPAGDARALADAVRGLYEMDPPARRRMGERGREYAAAEFDREVLIGRLEGWLQSLAGAAQGARAGR